MQLSRRELLSLFFGAPFAMAACQLGEARKFPDGEIVGQNVDLGQHPHVLPRARFASAPVIVR